jgi:hypothetical protein
MKLPFTRKIRLRIFWICLALGLAIGGGVFYYLVTEEFDDTKNIKASFSTEAHTLINEFDSNDSLANVRYRDQIIDVRGRVTELETADSSANLKIVDSIGGSYLIFDFQQQYAFAVKSLQTGDSVLLRASCSGSIFSRLLNTRSIQFKRTSLIQKF